MLNIIADTKFKKSFRKKDKFVQKKAVERIRIFRENPLDILLNNHPLEGEYKGKRSFNVTGDYRIIFYYINKDTVCFVDIGTHTELYG